MNEHSRGDKFPHEALRLAHTARGRVDPTVPRLTPAAFYSIDSSPGNSPTRPHCDPKERHLEGIVNMSEIVPTMCVLDFISIVLMVRMWPLVVCRGSCTRMQPQNGGSYFLSTCS